MAITPRSLLKNPVLLVATAISALIAMAGLSLFVATFVSPKDGKSCHRTVKQVDRLAPLRSVDCNYVLQEKGENVASWAHDDWVELAACFERADDPHRAATTAAWGVGFYPQSETLHNVRGYNLIVQEKWDEAVIALRVGLQSVEPTTGTLQNNLAWAGLYANDHMTLSEARRHYKDSLDVEPSSCEAIHTGMWVEYGIASRSSGSSRDAAIGSYRNLRAKYQPCTARAIHGDEITKLEVAGAAILDGEVEKLRMVQAFEKNRIVDARHHVKRHNALTTSLRGLDIDYSEVTDACEDIAPVASARPACRKALKSTLCKMRRR